MSSGPRRADQLAKDLRSACFAAMGTRDDAKDSRSRLRELGILDWFTEHPETDDPLRMAASLLAFLGHENDDIRLVLSGILPFLKGQRMELSNPKESLIALAEMASKGDICEDLCHEWFVTAFHFVE